MSAPSERPDTPRRGRPRTGSALSDAERARRYRERKKNRATETSQKSDAETVSQLQTQLAAAHDEIRQLKKALSVFVTKNDDSGKTWAIQDRKGNARWQTIEKGLSRPAAEKELDRLAKSVNTGRYTYRMIEE